MKSHPQFKPCRVTFEGIRYEIDTTGAVYQIDRETRARLAILEGAEAAEIRAEARRQRRNRAARERSATMRDLGMRRTPYGWE